MFLLSILFSLVFNVYAIDITPIKKGDPSPNDGFFVDAENMKKFRIINEEKKVLEVKNLKLEDLNYVNEKRIEFYKSVADESRKETSKAHIKGFIGTIGGFTVGIAVTGMAVYLATKVIK